MEKEVAIGFVKQHHDLPVKLVCDALSISKSTYYHWLKRNENKEKEIIVVLIGELCKEYKFRLGYRKITALVNRTVKTNHKVVQKIMQLYSLQCREKTKKCKLTGKPASLSCCSSLEP